jgi:hypothetical protein
MANPQAKQAEMQQDILESAQASVAKAVKKGEKLAKQLQKRGGKYRDWAGDTQAEMLGFLGEGQDPASYYSRIQGEFGPFMEGQQAQWQTQLNQGDYPVLGSAAHRRFGETLRETADVYEDYVKRAMPEIKNQFADLATNPAFNLQLDRRAMDLAQGNINQDQVKRLTTWNV